MSDAAEPQGGAVTEEPSQDPGEHRLMEHNYDGIQEYDNPLPGWWTFIFWVTIVFSPLYALYYHLGSGPLVADEYSADQQAHQQVVAAGGGGAVSEEALVALQGDGAAMERAKAVFQEKCAVCHGPLAQGLIGPNLTDDYWIHGGRLADIQRSIKQGVPEKGMIAWGALLAPDQLNEVAAYIGTLQGSNPPNPKAPEGEKLTR